jgi:hypothetical protein
MQEISAQCMKILLLRASALPSISEISFMGGESLADIDVNCATPEICRTGSQILLEIHTRLKELGQFQRSKTTGSGFVN